MANGKPTYAGKISSNGTQIVKAPITPEQRTNSARPKPTVKRGDDLRK